MKQRMIDENNYFLGIYVRLAVASCLSENTKYPSDPLLKEYYEDMELTQEERDEKELRKMLLYEEMWHSNDISRGLPETNIL